MAGSPLSMMAKLLIVMTAIALGGCATFDRAPERQPRAPSESTYPDDPRAPEQSDTDVEDDDQLRGGRYTPAPEPVREQYPRNLVEVSGPAVVSLHEQARQERDAGRGDNAVAVLERALRIEPRNPFLWSALAEAHLANEDPVQAENSAARANSLSRGNPHLERRNWETIARARRAAGDEAGAREAADRAESAQLRIQEI